MFKQLAKLPTKTNVISYNLVPTYQPRRLDLKAILTLVLQ